MKMGRMVKRKRRMMRRMIKRKRRRRRRRGMLRRGTRGERVSKDGSKEFQRRDRGECGLLRSLR
jgi:hypothetical protein